MRSGAESDRVKMAKKHHSPAPRGTEVYSSRGKRDFSQKAEPKGVKVINNHGEKGALEIDRSAIVEGLGNEIKESH